MDRTFFLHFSRPLASHAPFVLNTLSSDIGQTLDEFFKTRHEPLQGLIWLTLAYDLGTTCNSIRYLFGIHHDPDIE